MSNTVCPFPERAFKMQADCVSDLRMALERRLVSPFRITTILEHKSIETHMFSPGGSERKTTGIFVYASASASM